MPVTAGISVVTGYFVPLWHMPEKPHGLPPKGELLVRFQLGVLKNRCFSVFLLEQRFVFCLILYFVSANKEKLFSDLSTNKKG